MPFSSQRRRRARLLASACCVLLASCTRSMDPLPSGVDGGAACTGSDLLSDVKNCGGCNHACAQGASCSLGRCTPHWDNRYVINRFVMPRTNTDFAADLDGDGVPDNQLAALASAFVGIGLDAQPILDAALKVGANLELIHLRTIFVGGCADCLGGDEQVAADLFRGMPMIHPPLRGGGSFTVDGTQSVTRLLGALATSDFASSDPLTLRAATPVSFSLPLAFGFSGVPPLIGLPLGAARVRFHLDANPLTISKGQIQGAIKMTDVTGQLIPALASSLTQQLQQTESMIPTLVVMTLIQQFDQGGTDGVCVNPDGTTAKIGDARVDVCEVSTNPIIVKTLVPDVQLYDASGAYSPQPHGAKKDSLSVGIGFTGATARFGD